MDILCVFYSVNYIAKSQPQDDIQSSAVSLLIR